jgi:transposase-like protein
MRDVWSATPICFVVLPPMPPQPNCPYCGSGERIHIRSVGQGDGSQLQKFTCGKCSRRYRVCEERSIANVGNPDWHNL